MGNCINSNNATHPNFKIGQKRPTNTTRHSKNSNQAIPSYPSIEDVIKNNRRKANK